MTDTKKDLQYIRYDASLEPSHIPPMRRLISAELSEPYSIYVYRYFLYQWGHLCYLAMDPERSTNGNASKSADEQMVGVVVSKLEPHRGGGPLRGYIAMLAVDEEYRGRGIATRLVRLSVDAMIEGGADEIVLETEITNTPAIKLYERLGFLRSKRLHRYYLNGNSAYRLVLYLKEGVGSIRSTNASSFDPYAAFSAGAGDPLGVPPPAPLPLLGNGGGGEIV